MKTPLDAASAWIKQRSKTAWVNGQWTEASLLPRIPCINPATGAVLCEMSPCDTEQVRAAIDAAYVAWTSRVWADRSGTEKMQVMLDIADAIALHAEELAILESLDNGMPLSHSRKRVPGVVELFRYYAGMCCQIGGDSKSTGNDKLILTLREPVGVCALITAWNVPLGMAATKMAPALAAGNSIVLKPSEQTSLSTLRLVEIMHTCGLPSGVVNVVIGSGDVGQTLAESTKVAKVSFTGSTAVGRKIIQSSAVNIKKLSLELGGKSPHIVFDDADLDKAVEAAVWAFCKNTGQICSSGTRLFLQRSIHDQFLEKLIQRVQTLRVGDPLSSGTDLGPLASLVHREKIQQYIALGQEEGAQLAYTSPAVDGPGYYQGPVIFSQVQQHMRIAQEEIFGPVLCVLTFDTEEEALHAANESDYGLAAGVWTSNIHRALKFGKALESGRVWINTYGEGDVSMPTGGYKQSGYGKELGPDALLEFTQTKSLFIRIQ